MKLNQVYRRRLSLRLSIYLCLPAILTIALASLHWMPTGKASTPEPNHTQDITPAAIPNDTCATATVITPASLPFGIDAATDAAVNDIDPGLLGCVQGPGRDAVYSFIPATTGVYTVGATPTGIGFDISLYLVTDCANPATTCVAGANIDPLGKGESVSPTLTAGTRYFIVVDGATADTFGGFHLSLRSGLPSNDTCATPTLIEASRLPFSETASTFGANDDLNPDEPCLRTRQSGTGPEVIYQFTPADSQNYRLTVTPMGLYDTSIYIVTNCGSLVGCTSADFQGAGGAEFIQRNLTAGTTYFIVVDGFGGDSGDFSIFFEPSIPLAPNAPSNLVATALSGAEIRLNWDDNSSNELGFRIERSLDGFAFNEIATTEPNAEVFNDTTVAANTTYFYRVLAFNNFGNSAPSNVAGATTPEPPPPPVPVIAVSPNPLDFGSVRTSLTLTVTVSNNGGSDLVITAITDPAAPFSIVDKPA
ncbi:MAG TPA: fibronectin type III domain-containing protein, partial [Blastocatellia bacterium]|nr:fibronectin type III domain-containing protein [Blastocatellia bacterium]